MHALVITISRIDVVIIVDIFVTFYCTDRLF